jgi:hypothetical protein
MFKTVFPNWSDNYAKSMEEDMLANLKAQHCHHEENKAPVDTWYGMEDPETKKYSYDELKGKFP